MKYLLRSWWRKAHEVQDFRDEPDLVEVSVVVFRTHGDRRKGDQLDGIVRIVDERDGGILVPL